MVFLRSIVLAPFLALAALPGSAETVTLSSPGGLSMTGRFLGFDGEFYRLDTGAGPLAVLARGLNCTGAACPEGLAETLEIEVTDRAGRALAVALLRDFARTRDWPVIEHHDASGVRRLTMGPEDAPVFEVDFAAPAGAWRVLRDPVGAPPRGWREIALGFDGLVPAVSVDNTVTGLTLLGVRAALAGEFADWEGLGGAPDAPVAVHWAPALEGAVVRRYELAPGADAVRHDDVAEAADAIARTKGGLGLLPLSELGSAVPLVVTGPCGRGTLGVPAAIRSGDYPFSEAIVLRVPGGRAGPVARSLLDWLEAGRGAGAVRAAGFVDLAVRPVTAGRDGRQEADALSVASTGFGAGTESRAVGPEGALRLDVAMRFQDGSSLPDRAARVQIERLARAIEAGRFDGARLIFAGFSDSNGPAPSNLQLSRRRAEAIRAAVATAAGEAASAVELAAEGFGEAMPVACNGSDWGESLNRRVEVWLVPPG